MDLTAPLRSNKGATIIETVVALALSAIILTAIIGLAVNSLSSSTESRQRSQATRYAEEGVELVRAVRDSQTFDNFYSSFANGNTYYIASDTTYGYTLTTTAASDILQAAGSNFSRTVVITDPGTTHNRTLVQVKVTWYSRGKTDNVTEDTYLSKWAYN